MLGDGTNPWEIGGSMDMSWTIQRHGYQKKKKKFMKSLADSKLVITNEEINKIEETALGYAPRQKMCSHHLWSNGGASVAAMQGARKTLSWWFAH